MPSRDAPPDTTQIQGGGTGTRADVPEDGVDGDTRADAVAPILRQYRRRERPLSWLVALSVGAVCVGIYAVISLVPAVTVGILAIMTLRVPLWRSSGTVALHTDHAPDRVVESFAGPRPPVLAFQWGLADTVEIDRDTLCYEISYLFGLRTVEVVRNSRVHGGPAIRSAARPPAAPRSAVPRRGARCAGLRRGRSNIAYRSVMRSENVDSPGVPRAKRGGRRRGND